MGEGEEEGQDPLENFFNCTFDHKKGVGLSRLTKLLFLDGSHLILDINNKVIRFKIVFIVFIY